jgi:hypothetical protein
MKEFWILNTGFVEKPVYTEDPDIEHMEVIHVVDHDSYQQLLDEAMKLRNLLDCAPIETHIGRNETRTALANFDRFLEKGE